MSKFKEYLEATSTIINLSAMFGNIFSKNKTVLPPILCPNKIGLDK
jgi:hypothetical protein